MTTVDLTGTRMFRALFQYLPLRDSPNDQPQLELSLNPGDLIVVRGEMDEDGFYRGETVDGQCGLVPSNYVERVSDAWLSSTLPSTSREERIEGGRMDRSISHPAPSYMVHYFISLVFFITFYIQNRSQSPSFQLNVPPHFSSIVHDFTSDLPSSSTGTMHSFPFNIHYPYLTVMYRNPCSGPPPLPDSVCPYPPADVSRVTVTEIKETDTPRVPWPRDVTVEKRLSRSCIISWSPPEESYMVVSQYHICVDGKVRTIVPGNYKTRALVEDISMEGSSNLSIRSVTEHGHSPDAACTITLGLEAAIAPQHLRVYNITPVSACVRYTVLNQLIDN
ncbi:rimb-1 [Pristionchus pacificus]|uniref:Rimb-1 n=1 Tax=Pristionchus pacificus TaxID=54126 RepID=A0A2A6CCL5_PRIPA|nr:rimb-1 [Pristionchus pacificus]|eukprot:PDM75975.1 rimb-1 [Pristionchus pacificus]